MKINNVHEKNAAVRDYLLTGGRPMQVEERFLRYVKFDTQSAEDTGCSPSTDKQWDLARYLEQELRQIGAADVRLSEQAYVYATIPATAKKKLPALGFIAHMDTSSAASGANIQPVIARNYAGGDYLLNQEKQLYFPAADYPEINGYLGQDIIFSDGTTLLGADDKAGIAEIIAMAEHLLAHPEIEHGKICLAFTPDEEIGSGADHFDLGIFGADFAYTIDGGAVGEIEYECFNAAAANVKINGYSIHPGDARGKMKNALLIAMELQALLPSFENPACTDGYEGFFHLDRMQGAVEWAAIKYIIRDHDAAKFAAKKQLMQQAVVYLNHKYGENTVQLELRDTYYNMREKIEPHIHLIDNAAQALRDIGVEPKIVPIRGGTDGAALSFRGLPCPNLGTGGHNFHGRFEYIPIQSMEKVVKMLLKLVEIYGE
jgi:tripeptide aminopeptidase